MSTSTYRRAAAAALLLVTAACSASPNDPATAPPVSVAPTPPPQPCGAGAHAFFLPGPDNTKLEANAYGSGATTAILMHEAGFRLDMCGFWPFARWLAEHEHVQVLLFNRCTYGNSTCQVYQVGDRGIRGQVQPAVQWARRHGAKHVVLVGASSGASDSIQAGGVVKGIDAVVALSSDKTDTRTNEQRNAKRLRLPILLAVAPGDRSSPVAAVRTTFRLIRSKDKHLIVVRSMSGRHGWDLVQNLDGTSTPLARTVAKFVATRTAG